MRYIYEPIDCLKYPLNKKVKEREVDSFCVVKNDTEPGDIVVFYITNKVGFVGFGEVISRPYKQQNAEDQNYGQWVSDVKFLGFDFENPITLNSQEWNKIFPGESARSAHIFNPPQDVIDFYERLRCHE